MYILQYAKSRYLVICNFAIVEENQFSRSK